MTPATALTPSTLTVRLATVADRDAVLRILTELATQSQYTGRSVLNVTHLESVLDTLLNNPDAGFVVAEEDGRVMGLLVLLLADNLISGERYASEVCWYVRPSHRYGLGLRLLECGELWARRHGAVRLEMLSPDAKFDTLYVRRGYVLTNRVFERRI